MRLRSCWLLLGLLRWHAAIAFAHPPAGIARLRVSPSPPARVRTGWAVLSADGAEPAVTRSGSVQADGAAPSTSSAAMAPWLLVLMVFIHVLSNSLTAQAVPTAMLAALQNDRVRTAYFLGRISACGALIDILVAPQLGRLSDAVGRKLLLVLLPCISLCCRSVAALNPSIAVLAAVRILSATISSGYMVSLRASLADRHRWQTEVLTGRLGLISAASGAAHAGGMLLGGHLVARGLRWPYVTSVLLLSCLVPLIFFGLRESLPRESRTAFRWRAPGISFLGLFQNGRNLRSLCSISALQTLSISMGDTWQVFARELRGWGSVQCGLYGSLTGLGSMVSALLVRARAQCWQCACSTMQRAVGSGQWATGSGQWAVGSGQWAVGSGQ